MAGKKSKEDETSSPVDEKHDALVNAVREAIGEEKLAALSAQPTAIANGGREAILQRACKEAAGFPEPLAAAVAKFRVLCGSSAVPKVKKEN